MTIDGIYDSSPKAQRFMMPDATLYQFSLYHRAWTLAMLLA